LNKSVWCCDNSGKSVLWHCFELPKKMGCCGLGVLLLERVKVIDFLFGVGLNYKIGQLLEMCNQCCWYGKCLV